MDCSPALLSAINVYTPLIATPKAVPGVSTDPIIVGLNARVGANSVVLKSVPEGMSVVGVPAHEVGKQKLGEDFQAYGTTFSEVSKIDKSVTKIEKEINSLKEKITKLEKNNSKK